MNLSSLYLWGNQFSEEIPPKICNLTNLGILALTYNQLCPPYPACIENNVGEQDTYECEY